MTLRRTDLALEAKQLWQEQAGELTALPGVVARQGRCRGLAVDWVEISDQRGEQALGKARGRYVTLTLEGPLQRERDSFRRSVETVAQQLRELMDRVPPDGPVLVAGLGNRAIAPDAVGPMVHRHILVTRHLVEQAAWRSCGLRPVASLCAEVLGNTGIESAEVVRAVCAKVRPACVIGVDALASRSLERLCRTVQLTDTGIVPGSGVGNHRQGLTEQTLGTVAIGVGVPTVVEAATLCADLMGVQEPPQLGEGSGLLVSPKDIDSQVAQMSKIVGYGIDLALQPGLELEDLELLLN